MINVDIDSTAVSEDGRIPSEYGKEFRDTNPPVSFLDVPDATESLALIVEDPDAEPVVGYTFDHWLIWNMPPNLTHLPENAAPPGSVEGSNDAGGTGYTGPRPPDTEHTYVFKLYALDSELNLDTGSSKNALQEAMHGHVVEKAEMHGSYSPEQWQ